jgi:hypothetical protein
MSKAKKQGMAIYPVAYRYISPQEVAVVQASIPLRLPNFNASGQPKNVYLTWNYYTSVNQAEVALQIGKKNPLKATSSPSDRAHLNLSGVSYTNLGIVSGGTGTELITTGRPLVTHLKALTVP